MVRSPGPSSNVRARVLGGRLVPRITPAESALCCASVSSWRVSWSEQAVMRMEVVNAIARGVLMARPSALDVPLADRGSAPRAPFLRLRRPGGVADLHRERIFSFGSCPFYVGAD